MQRGRGRGRGRNTDPARGSSGRGDRSRSRTNIILRGRSRASLRRSARIAEILNNQLNNYSVSRPITSMANITRSRGHASTSVRSRQPLGNNRRPRSSRQSTSPDDIQYAMDIVVQPPSTSRAGYAINGTIIVRLRTANVYPDDANRDSYHLTALASLIPAGSSSGSSDPRALDRLLGGRRYVSVHPFSDDEADGSIAAMELDDPRGVGLMHFPDLSIHQAGTYRIRITLIRIANLDAPTISGGEHIQAIDSNPIVVQNSGSTSRSYEVNGGNEDDGGWNDTIREISMRQRSR